MAFDPKKYLEEKRALNAGAQPAPEQASGFDPKKYLQEKRALAQPQADLPMEEMPVSEDPSTMEALARSIEQGAAFGFGDELNAALAAMRSVGAPGQQKGFGDNYKENLAKERAAFKAAEEAHPVASLAGNVGGGLITGGPALKLLGLMGKAGSAATAGGRIMQATKAGAGMGAIAGLGHSEADLTSGELKDYLKATGDTLKGAAFGGATGGVVSGLTEGGSALYNALAKRTGSYAELPLFRKMKEAAKLGYDDEVNIVGEPAFKEAGRNLFSKTQGLEDELAATEEKIFGHLNALKNQELDPVLRAQMRDEAVAGLKEVLEEVENIKALSPNQINERNRLIETLKNALEGEKKTVSVNKKVFTPGKNREIKAIRGSEEEAQKAINAAKAIDQKNNVQAEYVSQKIMNDDGTSQYVVSRYVDEPIGAPERTKMIKAAGALGMPAADEAAPVVTKPILRRSVENSPAGKKAAEEASAKLNVKAQREQTGSVFHVEHDGDNGFYHVVETRPVKPKATPSGDGGAYEEVFDPGNAEDIFKPGEKTLFNKPYVEAQPARTETLPGKMEHVTEELTGRVNPTNFEDLGEALAVKTKLQQSAYETTHRVPEVEALAKRASGYVKDATELPFEGPAPINPITGKPHNQLRDLNDELSQIQKAREAIPSESNLAQAEGTTGSQALAEHRIQKFLDIAKNIPSSKYMTDEVAKDLTKAGTRLDLAKIANAPTGINNPLGSIQSLMVRGANTGGLVAKDIVKQTPDAIKELASVIAKNGAEAYQFTAKVLEQMAMKDQKGRNAIIFALSQNAANKKKIEEAAPGFFEYKPEEKSSAQ